MDTKEEEEFKKRQQEIKKFKDSLMKGVKELNEAQKKQLQQFIDKHGVDYTKPFALSNSEFYEISRGLESKHSVFYKFWEIGSPKFTMAIPTACVVFDKKGYNTGFYFNTKFWFELDEYTRLWVITHECLHIILNHGTRTVDTKDKVLANKALDVVVNMATVKNFGFIRKSIQNGEKYCWLDTVFAYKLVKGKPLPPEGKSFEYYFNMLKDDRDSGERPSDEDGEPEEGGSSSGGNQLVDNHDGLGDEDFSDAIREVSNILTDQQKESLKDFIKNNFQEDNSGKDQSKSQVEGGQEAGTSIGGWFFRERVLVKKKKKWETVVKKWSMTRLQNDIRAVEQFVFENRRLSAIDFGDFALPYEFDIEDNYLVEGRLNVWLCLDTSGSCIHLKDRFFRAAQSLDPSRFHIRLFCFDTAMEQTSLKSKKVYGGGGTCFACIESKIQHIIKNEKINYPDSVWLLTDSFGTSVNPQYPERWHVFNTDFHDDPYKYFPKQVKTFQMKDYE